MQGGAAGGHASAAGGHAGATGGHAGAAGGHAGAAGGHGAVHGGGGSDLFRPRAGSDSRAPSVLGKMRTRWRSGEGQALQPGVGPCSFTLSLQKLYSFTLYSL